MNHLPSLSNNLLHFKTLSAASDEKAATLVLLEFLAEIDRRRLYAVLGYTSLWEYVHKALQYSEAQTSDRVSSMRLMVKVPEVKAELESGKLTLTTTAKLGAHVRREKLKPEETISLLHEISGKSSREVERLLVSQSTEQKKPDRIRPITSELTRISIDVDQEFLDLVQAVKDKKGNPALSLQEVFRIAMRKYVKKASLRAPEVRVAPPKKAAKSRYIPAAIKAVVRARSGDRCEYVEVKTKRRCEGRSGLEFDHIKPFANGGEHTEENLRHYCRAHNTLAAVQAFGKAKMQPFMRV